MILEMRMKSKLVLRQLLYYNLSTKKKKIRKFTCLKYSFFRKRTVTINQKKNSLETPSLDDIFGEILHCQIQLF